MGSNTDFSTLQGGQWKDQNVNDSGGSGTDLFNWLTKETSGARTGTKAYTPGLVPRGFSTGELHKSNKGQTVATQIQNIITHESPGDFQKALSYLLFVCPWDNALLGHACWFLLKFCDEVAKDREKRLEKS
ncbi:hypothetical protein X943_002538 [Babesia divergens]|uniref:Uncharacterized protein n=1 Tax=Babesia divergens TaxID=32595 RepID=A0AAD9GE89_BABDI|nr:hypothetical protein X943_002538 [Babesia divergens]